MKKLQLKKEVVAMLQNLQTKQARGGAGFEPPLTYYSCAPCNNDSNGELYTCTCPGGNGPSDALPFVDENVVFATVYQKCRTDLADDILSKRPCY